MSKQEKGYNGNPNLPRENSKIEWTPDLISEFIKCKNDPVYFAERYMKIVHIDRGLITIPLYDYQKEIIRAYPDNLKIALNQSRQSGKSTVVTVIVLHFIIFNSAKRVGLLAQKLDQAIDLMSRVQLGYEYLPPFLKPGVKEWNKKSFVLDNGSTVIAGASSSSAVRGRSLSLLVLDEHSHIPNYDEFAASVLPTLSSGKESRLIIASTPYGLNHFYDLVTGAREGKNGFWLKEVPWYDVPGRDDNWKQKTLADLNYDILKFSVEYELEFAGSSGTLLNGSTLKALNASAALSSKDGLSIYTEKLPNRVYTMDCDVSHGKGLDYSAFSVIDVTELPYKQVATYRNNLITPKDYAEIINNVGRYYNDAYLLVENNDIGSQVTYILWNEFEYAHMLSSQGAGRHGKKLVVGVGSKTDYGIRMTSSVKKLGCSILKLLIEQNQLIIVDKDTITELSRFSKKNDSYAAEEGCTDDMVMGLVNFAWMSTTECFKEISGQDVVGDMTDFDDDELSIKLLGMGVKYDGVDDVIAYEKFDGDDDLWVKHDYPIGSWG
jgi:Terminase large subunit, T4likevirus-type, N-terminal/Terminase RNaseH-like domain